MCVCLGEKRKLTLLSFRSGGGGGLGQTLGKKKEVQTSTPLSKQMPHTHLGAVSGWGGGSN
jgi:hypothetical protein